MPSTYTQNGGIEKPANGEQSGTWGTTANTDFDIIDRLTNGVGTITLSTTTYTLTTASGSLSEGQYKVLVFSGSIGSTCTVTISPNTAQKYFFVRNTTSQSVILTQGSGATVTIPAGGYKIIYSDGGGTTAAVYDFTASFWGSSLTSASALALSGAGTVSLTATGANVITASTNGSERLRIDSSGNVGIGTSSVSYKLQLNNTTAVDTETGVTNSAGTSRFGTRSSGNAFAGAFTAGKSLELWSANSLNATLDASGNLGLGVTPSAWDNSWTALQLKYGASVAGLVGGYTLVRQNALGVTGADNYIANGYATDYYQYNGQHIWRTAPSGTAGNPITFTQAMTLDASGNLGVGITPTQKLHVSGNAIITGSFTGGGQLIGGTDSASAPTHTWTGDLTTGLFRVSAGVVGVSTGGTERLRIDSTTMTLASGIGVNSTAANDGTKSSGTYTPTPAGGNFKYIVNGGAFSLAAPTQSGDYSIVVQMSNSGASGAVTMSGFTKVTGDAFSTVSTDKFMVFITKCNGFTTAVVQALQ